MTRLLVIFVLTAGIGGLLTLAIRSAWHHPYAEPAVPQMQTPAATPTPVTEPASAPDPHAGHTTGSSKQPVNSVCAICGMDADPKLTTTFRDQVIAFGCAKCPAKFAKDPERFGPYFLRNEEAP